MRRAWRLFQLLQYIIQPFSGSQVKFKIEGEYTIFAGISENFELHEFPFDLQNLNIRISMFDRSHVNSEESNNQGNNNDSSQSQFIKLKRLGTLKDGGREKHAYTLTEDGSRVMTAASISRAESRSIGGTVITEEDGSKGGFAIAMRNENDTIF